MRARKKKNTIPRLKRCEELLSDKISPPERKKICLEIGCGKGQFITGLAKKHPDIEYYAMERVPDVIVMAAEKGLAEGLTNLHFLLADASSLPEICPDNSIDVIYLNFSDPWPKARQEVQQHKSEAKRS